MKMVSYRDISTATNGFSSSNLIGSGSLGVVYTGFLEADQMLVAVKVFILEQIGASKSFLSECEALQNIRGQLALEFSFILANKAPDATRQHKGMYSAMKSYC